MAFTPHRHTQEDVTRELTAVAPAGFERFAQSSRVETRNLAAHHAVPDAQRLHRGQPRIHRSGHRPRRSRTPHLDPADVDVIVTVSSAGVAVPTIDARLASRSGVRPNVTALKISERRTTSNADPD